MSWGAKTTTEDGWVIELVPGLFLRSTVTIRRDGRLVSRQKVWNWRSFDAYSATVERASVAVD